MLIDLTQADIDAGLRYEPALCPVGRAISRAYGVPCYVGAYTVSIGGKLKMLPVAVRDFVELFDAKQSVEPQTFVM